MQVGSAGGTYPNPRLLSNHTAKTPNNASKSAPSKLVFVNSTQASISCHACPVSTCLYFYPSEVSYSESGSKSKYRDLRLAFALLFLTPFRNTSRVALTRQEAAAKIVVSVSEQISSNPKNSKYFFCSFLKLTHQICFSSLLQMWDVFTMCTCKLLWCPAMFCVQKDLPQDLEFRVKPNHTSTYQSSRSSPQQVLP